jgi:hypothetical protein
MAQSVTVSQMAEKRLQTWSGRFLRDRTGGRRHR